VERRRFGILEKERDVADAQAAILKQGAREITSHLIENMAEWRALLGQAAGQRPPADRKRCGNCVERQDGLPQMLYQYAADACTFRSRGTRRLEERLFVFSSGVKTIYSAGTNGDRALCEAVFDVSGIDLKSV
jgi:hypothetical protein